MEKRKQAQQKGPQSKRLFVRLEEWILNNIIHCNVDVFDTFLVGIFCFISVSCFVAGIKLLYTKEYLAGTLMFAVGAVFFRDVCKAVRKTKKEISVLEKRIDEDWKVLLGKRYHVYTCRTCADRFSCKNAYGEKEVNGTCSINKCR